MWCEQPTDDAGFSNRDIILTNESLLNAEPSASNPLQLTIVYVTAKKSNKINSPTVKVQKTWRILFDTTGVCVCVAFASPFAVSVRVLIDRCMLCCGNDLHTGA
jgi:hypothetical protein